MLARSLLLLAILSQAAVAVPLVVSYCTVVATGGLAELIMPVSETIEHHEPWLTLHGLRIIWQRNQ